MYRKTGTAGADLWYLSEEILMELSGRDSINYRIAADKVELTHDSEGC